MNTVAINIATEIKDLGVIVNNTLTWTNHIYATVRKANTRVWLCMRALGFHAPIRAKKTCYITMVRSILEYGAPIWSLSLKHLIIDVERIQRRATNYILGNPKRPDPRHINYKDRLLELTLLPLTYRREILDIQTFLKAFNGPNKIGLDNILEFSQPNLGVATRAMATGLTLKYTKTRLVATAHFYPYRLSQTWNKLPLTIREKLRFLKDSLKIKRILVLLD